MVYAMSDLHGEREKFRKILNMISFSEDDDLYILGDVVDRGPDPVGLLQDISEMPNVFNILGNHELMAMKVLKLLLEEVTDSNYSTHITGEVLSYLLDWQANGGQTTLDGFQKLPKEKRLDLIDFMEDFTPYEVIDVSDRTFILVHSGLGNYSPGKALDNYSIEELVSVRPVYSEVDFPDNNIFIVCGHTPTIALTGEPRIYHEKSYINIDCGSCFPGGKLACLRLDDLQEFYI